MTTTHEPVAVPHIVDREAWQSARDELLVREKAHMRAGDAIAAARRRLPMTEVDATITVVGSRRSSSSWGIPSIGTPRSTSKTTS